MGNFCCQKEQYENNPMAKHKESSSFRVNLIKRLKNLSLSFSSKESNILTFTIPEKDLQDNSKFYIDELESFKVSSLKMLNNYDEHCFYENIIKTDSENMSIKKIERIRKEIKWLSVNLPVFYSNSIFLKYDENRIDIMRTCITGQENSPYQNGLFFFDIFLDSNYPDYPPKIKGLFNPNSAIRFCLKQFLEN